jgi:hypothetical protein
MSLPFRTPLIAWEDIIPSNPARPRPRVTGRQVFPRPIAPHLAQHRSPPHTRWIAANFLSGPGLSQLPSFLFHSIKVVKREAAKNAKQKLRVLRVLCVLRVEVFWGSSVLCRLPCSWTMFRIHRDLTHITMPGKNALLYTMDRMYTFDR